MEKRPCGVLPCKCPGPGASGTVSSVCSVCSAIVSWLLYAQASHLQLLWAVFVVWPECGTFKPGVHWSGCETRPVAAAPRAEASQNSWVRGCHVGRALGRSSRERVLLTWGSGERTEKDGSSWRGRGGGVDLEELGVSKSGSTCQHCTASYRWPRAYAEGQGSKMIPASFLFQEGSLHECCLSGTRSEMSE